MGNPFTIAADFKGINPFDPTAFEEPPAGPHEVEILSAEQSTEKKQSFFFNVRIKESGMTTNIVVGSDMNKDGNRKHAKALIVGMLQAAGKPATAADGPLQIPSDQFVGKTAFIYVKPAPEGEVDEQGRRPFANKNFISKDLFEKLKAQAPAGAQATGAQTPTGPTPANAGGKPANLANLFG